MNGSYRLNEDHTVSTISSMEEFGSEYKRERHVGHDTIGASRISTVFLVLDHGWGEGLPVLFETMVFGGPLDRELDRYCTWDEAVAGHASMIERVKAAQAASAT